jgi:hypothetical protein
VNNHQHWIVAFVGALLLKKLQITVSRFGGPDREG